MCNFFDENYCGFSIPLFIYFNPYIHPSCLAYLDITKIENSYFVSYRPRWPRQVKCGLSDVGGTGSFTKNFAKLNTTLRVTILWHQTQQDPLVTDFT
jgi:hypothetical protein